MGFFQDVAKNPLTITPRIIAPITNFMPNAYGTDSAPQEGSGDSGNTYIGGAIQNASRGLADTTYSTADPYGYTSIFNQGYQKLDQPLNDPAHDRTRVAVEGTRTLASTFIDAYHNKTGKMPTQDQVRSFVGQNLTPDFAKQFIVGLPTDQITEKYAKPYIENLPELNPSTNPADATKMTMDQLDSIYNPLQESAISQVRRNFAPLRSRAIEEEAALGRLRSGVSADPSSSIGQVDANEGNAIQGVIANILGQKATGTLDLTKFNATNDLAKQNAKEAKNEFQQNLAFNQNAYQDQSDLANKQLNISQAIGRLQAQKNQPNWLDYLNTAANVGGTAAKLYGLGK